MWLEVAGPPRLPRVCDCQSLLVDFTDLHPCWRSMPSCTVGQTDGRPIQVDVRGLWASASGFRHECCSGDGERWQHRFRHSWFRSAVRPCILGDAVLYSSILCPIISQWLACYISRTTCLGSGAAAAAGIRIFPPCTFPSDYSTATTVST